METEEEGASDSAAAKLHIEEIRTHKFYIGKNQPNPLTNDLHRAVANLSKQLYQKDDNFLMELILNADENEYEEGVKPTLEFVMTQKDITETGAMATLLAFNNEVGFSRENVESICSIGCSTKKKNTQNRLIGDRGIGFRSVFHVSSQPHIYSKGYCIKFYEEPNEECGIGYVVPHWISGQSHWISGQSFVSSIIDVYGLRNALPTTTIILPLKAEKVEAVRVRLSQLHPEILLFLSKLRDVSVRGCDPKAGDDVSRFCKSVEPKQRELRGGTSCVAQLSVKRRMRDSEELRNYFLWEEAFPVRAENRVGIRKSVHKCVVTLAFPREERMRKAASSVGIFALLPTEMITRLPFLIQADFILNSSRKSIVLDNKWNLGILECVPSSFVNAFQSWSIRSSAGQPFKFVPAQASPIPQFNNIRESIRTKLLSLVIVPCQILKYTLHFALPKDAVRVLPRFRDLVIRFQAKYAVLRSSSSSSLRRVLHPSLDIREFNAVLDYLGVTCAGEHWYTGCVLDLVGAIKDKLATANGIILFLECMKFLTSIPRNNSLLPAFTKSIANSPCFMTLDGYKTPEECVLLDPAWEGILKPTDTPSIDVEFYGTEIFRYKNQLRDLGVKVDPLSVCSVLSETLVKLAILPSMPETAFITRIYNFLNKFQWRPQVSEESKFEVWIPDPPPGGWMSPKQCVLRVDQVRQIMFSSFFCLHEYYAEQLLPLFSSAFGVAETPSIHHYLELWETWGSWEDSQITLVECCSFLQFVIDNWSPRVDEIMRQKLTKLPATKSNSDKIYLMNRTEVFLADDLQLKKIFSSYEEAPLFVWFPISNYLSSISDPAIRMLYTMYESLGVRKVSESCVIKPYRIISLEDMNRVDARNGMIAKGLIKILLGFLAGPHVNMPLKERHDAASSVIELSVYRFEGPYHVIYQLMKSASTTADVIQEKLVHWKKSSHRLLIDDSAYENGNTDLEFVTAFADELAQGLLVHARPHAASLSRLIQMGFMFDFNDKEVDLLLMRENLDLSAKDHEFLEAAFPSSRESAGNKCGKRSSDPSTSTPSPLRRSKRNRL